MSAEEEVRRFFRDAYLFRFLRELRVVLERSGSSACSQAVEQVIEIGNAVVSGTSSHAATVGEARGSGLEAGGGHTGASPTGTTSPASPTAADVRRRAAALLECLARSAGESTDEPMVSTITDPGASCREGSPGSSEAGPPEAALPEGESPEAGPAWDPVILPVVIYLPHVRSPYNLGAIVRTAAAFGIAGVVCGPDSPSIDHPRARRAAMGTFASLPVVRGGWDQVVHIGEARFPGGPGESGGSAELPVFAVETGGTPITEAKIPERSVLIFGHEEFGVPPEELKRGEESGGVITIPHGGTKASLNVGVSVGIVLAWIDQGLSSIR
jgi:tRNA(Leu) C34 or U34 (ribose-2'-O)-methylase TrmL